MIYIYYFGRPESSLLCKGFPLATVSGSSAPSCGSVGSPLQWLLLLWSAGSADLAHALSCSASVMGIFPDQGLNPIIGRQISKPLSHPGSPENENL